MQCVQVRHLVKKRATGPGGQKATVKWGTQRMYVTEEVYRVFFWGSLLEDLQHKKQVITESPDQQFRKRGQPEETAALQNKNGIPTDFA